MNDQELGYHEALALLPAYAAGQLDAPAKAAVDAYLQRQIALFQQLDQLETTEGQNRDAREITEGQNRDAREITEGQNRDARETSEPTPRHVHRTAAQAAPADEAPFTRVMEGQVTTDQLPGNPLLMRTAPQAYVDQQSGQRYVVPRRGTLQPADVYAHSATRRFGGGFWRRLLWALLAVATAIAILVIGVYQQALQMQLDQVEEQMALISRANRALTLHNAEQSSQGTLLIRGRQGLIAIHGLERLSPNQDYQLWLRAMNGEEYAALLITAQPAVGSTWRLFELPIHGSEVTAAGISIEPAGGSQQPTTPMLLQSGF